MKSFTPVYEPWELSPDTLTVYTTNDRLWEIPKLVDHLVRYQGQDLVLNINPEAQSLEACGLYTLLSSFKFKSVTIYTWNVLESHPVYTIKYKNPKFFFARPHSWEPWNITDKHRLWNKTKVFGTYYGRPTADRLALSSHLFCHHRDITSFSLAFDPVKDTEFFELEKMFGYDTDSVKHLAQLLDHLPLNPILYRPGKFDFYNPLADQYQDIFIDVISEPNVSGNSFFFTEKTVRTFLLQKPFILMGSQNTLCYLRQMGFKTFHDFWDEDYDGYSDRQRYAKIIALINSLASYNVDQLFDMYQAMMPILQHNCNLILNQTFSTEVTAI